MARRCVSVLLTALRPRIEVTGMPTPSLLSIVNADETLFSAGWSRHLGGT
jgi:hypothetical protein